VLRLWLLACVLGCWGASAGEGQPELSVFEVMRGEEGLALNFSARFDLPPGVEDALLKGVPLHFVADAALFRERWYWRDQLVSRVSRTWRLAYQPLTRSYRVSFGGLNQSFDSAAEAVAVVRRMAGWRLAEPGQLDAAGKYYVEFSYKLDTTLLPRPMQISIDGQPDWSLHLERVQRLAAPKEP
jgi:hypothetical protein